MNYLVTARKWRPRTFEQLIGQEHVSRTIQNAIKSDRIAHAFLFSGPRGVGKTTMARLIAKALNCENGPTEQPCDKCSYCQSISDNSSLDFYEIDGASNRGIEKVRELKESLQYSSPNQKHRIFVIDEVHMLTIEAFNALLKSLEEPPPKVIFIFCTTESHKIPLTIKSRCQHYNFRAFSIEEISGHLQTILKKEKITYEEDALFQIAKAANGSMRDSQSILDQVISYSNNNISQKAVFEVLGLNSSKYHFHFIENLINQKYNEIFTLLHKLTIDGKDLKQFILELVSYFNSLILIKQKIEDLNILQLSKSDYESLLNFNEKFTSEELFLINDIFSDLIKELKSTYNPNIIINIHMMKLIRYKSLITPDYLRRQLNMLMREVQVEKISEIDVNAALLQLAAADKDLSIIYKNISFLNFNNDILHLSLNKDMEDNYKKSSDNILNKITEKLNQIYNKSFKIVIKTAVEQKSNINNNNQPNENEKNEVIDTLVEEFNGEIVSE